jgi:hypothetical protein
VFGEVLRSFTGSHRADFETEQFRQQRSGGAKTKLAIFFHRTARRPAGSGLIKMAGECDLAIERLVGAVGSLFAVPGLPLTLDHRLVAIAALQHFERQLFSNLSRQAFRSVKKRLDYSEFGGAPLLGCKQIVLICHSSSTSKAIRNAIRLAKEFYKANLSERIERELSDVALTSGE